MDPVLGSLRVTAFGANAAWEPLLAAGIELRRAAAGSVSAIWAVAEGREPQRSAQRTYFERGNKELRIKGNKELRKKSIARALQKRK